MLWVFDTKEAHQAWPQSHKEALALRLAHYERHASWHSLCRSVKKHFSRHFEHFNQYVDIVQKSIGTIGYFFGSHGTLTSLMRTLSDLRLVLGSRPQFLCMWTTISQMIQSLPVAIDIGDIGMAWQPMDPMHHPGCVMETTPDQRFPSWIQHCSADGMFLQLLLLLFLSIKVAWGCFFFRIWRNHPFPHYFDVETKVPGFRD